MESTLRLLILKLSRIIIDNIIWTIKSKISKIYKNSFFSFAFEGNRIQPEVMTFALQVVCKAQPFSNHLSSIKDIFLTSQSVPPWCNVSVTLSLHWNASRITTVHFVTLLTNGFCRVQKHPHSLLCYSKLMRKWTFRSSSYKLNLLAKRQINYIMHAYKLRVLQQ